MGWQQEYRFRVVAELDGDYGYKVYYRFSDPRKSDNPLPAPIDKQMCINKY
jgi:hypothetical protein